MSVRGWIVGFGAAVVLAACGSGGNPMEPGPPVTSAEITIVDNAFGPSSVSITQGGTVTWTWAPTNTAQHNVRWGSGPVVPTGSATQATGDPYQVTFTISGTYEFNCSLHVGMTGTVAVQ